MRVQREAGKSHPALKFSMAALGTLSDEKNRLQKFRTGLLGMVNTVFVVADF